MAASFLTGADVNARDRDGQTPLFHACKASNVDAVRELLIERGADPNVQDAVKQTAFFYAVLDRDTERSVEMLQLLVDANGQPSLKDHLGQTAMYYAARDGNNDAVRFLSQHGCSPNDRDVYGQTPMYYAAREGRSDTVETLIDCGGDVNSVDLMGQSALFYAARDGRIDTVRLMLSKGADVNIRDKKRLTALNFAKKAGQEEVVRCLTEAGAQTAAPAKPPKTPTAAKRTSTGAKKTAALAMPSPAQPGTPATPVTPVSLAPLTPQNHHSEHLELPGDGNGGPAQVPQVAQVPQLPPMPPAGPLPGQSPADKAKVRFRLRRVEPDGSTRNLSERELEEFELRFPDLALWPGTIALNVPGDPRANWQQLCKKIIKAVWDLRYAWLFQHPVDYVKLKIPDYPLIVKQPMDFGTVKKKLASGQYASPEEFVADMRLVFHNCLLYNPAGTEVSLMCNYVHTAFEKLLVSSGLA